MVPGLSMIGTTKGQILLAFSAIYIMVGLAILGMFMSVIAETMEKMAARKAEEQQRQITVRLEEFWSDCKVEYTCS